MRAFSRLQSKLVRHRTIFALRVGNESKY
uniref:Uncharacterized protein n=1 Tax=Anguilla anguilla TaxID=7936 RepID=A0A0E9VJ97_ANGAN